MSYNIDDKIKNKFNGEYERVSDYVNNEELIIMRHKVCGNEYEVKPHNFLRNNNHGRCPFCYSAKNLTKEMFQWKLDHVYNHTKNNGFKVLEFNGMNYKARLEHSCGHIWTPEARSIVQGKGCPMCSHRSFGYNPEEIKEEIFNLTEGEYVVLSDYKNESTPIKMIHSTCGHIFYPTRRNFIYNNTRCPLCYRKNNRSKGENIIISQLKKLKINYEEEYQDNECKNERPLPFDFKIGNILIEYDGAQHFFNRRDDLDGSKLRQVKMNDSIKNNFVLNSKKYKLIRIPYTVRFGKIKNIINEISSNINKDKILSSTTIEKYNLMVIDNSIDNNYYKNINKKYFITE